MSLLNFAFSSGRRIVFAALLMSAMAWALARPLYCAAAANPCVDLLRASELQGKTACVRAHVYNVVELHGGTRYLDVCSPETPDASCHFFIVSFREDAKEVGNLERLKATDIEIRGTLRPYEGRTEIVLSHQRQLHGGGEKFVPNPQLHSSDFSALDHDKAFNDREGGKGTHFTHAERQKAAAVSSTQ